MDYSARTTYHISVILGNFRRAVAETNAPGTDAVKRYASRTAIGLLVFTMACGPVVRTEHVTTDQPTRTDSYEFVVRADRTITDDNNEFGSILEILTAGQRLAVGQPDSEDGLAPEQVTFKFRAGANLPDTRVSTDVLTSFASELGILANIPGEDQILASARNLIDSDGAATTRSSSDASPAAATSATGEAVSAGTNEYPALQPQSGAVPSGLASVSVGADGTPAANSNDQQHADDHYPIIGPEDTSNAIDTGSPEPADHSTADSSDSPSTGSSPESPGILGNSENGSTESGAGEDENGNGKTKDGDPESSDAGEPGTADTDSNRGSEQGGSSVNEETDDDSAPSGLTDSDDNGVGSNNSNSGIHGNGNGKLDSSNANESQHQAIDDSDGPGQDERNDEGPVAGAADDDSTPNDHANSGKNGNGSNATTKGKHESGGPEQSDKPEHDEGDSNAGAADDGSSPPNSGKPDAEKSGDIGNGSNDISIDDLGKGKDKSSDDTDVSTATQPSAAGLKSNDEPEQDEDDSDPGAADNDSPPDNHADSGDSEKTSDGSLSGNNEQSESKDSDG